MRCLGTDILWQVSMASSGSESGIIGIGSDDSGGNGAGSSSSSNAKSAAVNDQTTQATITTECSICYGPLDAGQVAGPNACSHEFCGVCARQWVEEYGRDDCPMCRTTFRVLVVRMHPGGPVITRTNVAPFVQARKARENAEEQREGGVAGAGGGEAAAAAAGHWEDDEPCAVCNRLVSGLGEAIMIQCDACDKWYHLLCLEVPLDEVPEGEWACSPACQRVLGSNDEPDHDFVEEPEYGRVGLSNSRRRQQQLSRSHAPQMPRVLGRGTAERVAIDGSFAGGNSGGSTGSGASARESRRLAQLRRLAAGRARLRGWRPRARELSHVGTQDTAAGASSIGTTISLRAFAARTRRRTSSAGRLRHNSSPAAATAVASTGDGCRGGGAPVGASAAAAATVDMVANARSYLSTAPARNGRHVRSLSNNRGPSLVGAAARHRSSRPPARQIALEHTLTNPDFRGSARDGDAHQFLGRDRNNGGGSGGGGCGGRVERGGGRILGNVTSSSGGGGGGGGSGGSGGGGSGGGGDGVPIVSGRGSFALMREAREARARRAAAEVLRAERREKNRSAY